MLSASALASLAATALKKPRMASFAARRATGESRGSSSFLSSAPRPTAGWFMVLVLRCRPPPQPPPHHPTHTPHTPPPPTPHPPTPQPPTKTQKTTQHTH